MDFRHEWKHEINVQDMFILRQRLKNVLQYDSHSPDGRYKIRSLYFDDIYDTALREKINGVNKREKYRIRFYNCDTSFISLEKKSKINGLCKKESEVISQSQAQKIIDGDYQWMLYSGSHHLAEFYSKIKGKGLQPKTIVDYTREAYVFPPGNVRITLDYNIRTGMRLTDFLNTECITVPVFPSPVILEVKWDEFLPEIIRDTVQLEGRRAEAFSKYAICRIYD